MNVDLLQGIARKYRVLSQALKYILKPLYFEMFDVFAGTGALRKFAYGGTTSL